MTQILAGDIGGTKVNLGIFSLQVRRPRLRIMKSYASRDFPNLESILDRFLFGHSVRPDCASFAVAGPVINGRCVATNLPWVIEEARLQDLLSLDRVSLINDLAATAYAVPFLKSSELVTLNRGVRRRGTIGVVAPGTGLGEAFLYWDGDSYHPMPTEGGHADFPQTNSLEVELWQWMRRGQPHVSVERILSGPGLVQIYDFLKTKEKWTEPTEVDQAPLREKARVISELALNTKNKLCEKALDLFVSICGAEAGNFALKGMTIGGIYLGGGIAPKILDRLKHETFMRAFTDKGRFSTFLSHIPVKVILNERTALLGAALYGLRS
ncbi:MAG: glucokinase [Pseudomonadota bacterium]